MTSPSSRKSLAGLSLALAVVLAGCVGEWGGVGGSAEPTTGPEDASSAAAWPPLDEAAIRPGAKLTYLGPVLGVEQKHVAGCTANFVFRSPDNSSIFLGTAAHCVDDVGDAVEFEKGIASGVVWYSSFGTMEDVGESDAALLAENDFALVRVDDEHRALVHPAVHHFGGPTGVASVASLRVGEPLRMFGNTDLRPSTEESHRHAGCLAQSTPWYVRTTWVAPEWSGDSGAPVLTANGEAVGLHRGRFFSEGDEGTAEAVALEAAVAYAKQHAGLEFELATWPLITDSTFVDPGC